MNNLRYKHRINEKKWKVLLVDDNEEVHKITKLVLRHTKFEGKEIEFLSVYSSVEAKKVLSEQEDICLIFLDVVMESDQSGLDLVQCIREEFKDHFVRIVLRTGQAGMAPESSVILNYDINDYKEKIDLTSQKLHTTLIASLRSYRDIVKIHEQQGKLVQQAKDLKETLIHLQLEILERKRLETKVSLEKRTLKKNIKELNLLNQGFIHEISSFFDSEVEDPNIQTQFKELKKLLTQLNILRTRNFEDESLTIEEFIKNLQNTIKNNYELDCILKETFLKNSPAFVTYPKLIFLILDTFCLITKNLIKTHDTQAEFLELNSENTIKLGLRIKISYEESMGYLFLKQTDLSKNVSEILARYLMHELLLECQKYFKKMDVKITHQQDLILDILFIKNDEN